MAHLLKSINVNEAPMEQDIASSKRNPRLFAPFKTPGGSLASSFILLN